MSQNILVSGLYSGPSPSAGLGVARSVREAYPDLKIIGMDYWAGSSGLHDPVFDEVKVMPSWDLMDHATHKDFLETFVNEGGIYLPTLDLETHWLARNMQANERCLSPHQDALSHTKKPHATITKYLPFSVPEFITLDHSEDTIYDFCRRHSWRVWLKGPFHDAVCVQSWRALAAHREALRRKWSSNDLSLQAHKRGVEESVCFAAVNGELLDAVYMRKRVTTPDGKTWSGKIESLPKELFSIIKSAAKSANWHGGAEIELLRTADGTQWFMECNPRFPAWIYGATLAGVNLPAQLIRALTTMPSATIAMPRGSQFTRVVSEISVSDAISLPLVAAPTHGQISMSGKYGAGLSALAELIDESAGRQKVPMSEAAVAPVAADLLLVKDIMTVPEAPTPHRILLPETTKGNFAAVKHLIATYGGRGFLAAYSLKTNPDDFFLNEAKGAGMFAECISLLEVKKALASGWSSREIILNGPAKWWPNEANHQSGAGKNPELAAMQLFDGLHAVFADSIEEMERLIESGRNDSIWGIRVKIPGFKSRFGIEIDTPQKFARLCRVISRIPTSKKVGLHLHLASNLIGNGHWHDAVESLLVWARNIEASTTRRISAIDLGGGYHPRDLGTLPWAEIISYLHQGLDRLEQVIIEPGRALTQNAMAMVSTILDVRRDADHVSEVVLDTCIAELPLIEVYPHRFFFQGSAATPTLVKNGKTRILGRICMEDDVLSPGLDLPANVKIGDKIIIGDAGAYERSMSYGFGRGGY